MTTKKRTNFYNSPEGQEIRQSLINMSASDSFNTDSTYSADSSSHPDNLISFVDKHMRYLDVHPGIDATQYLANLRLMTRIN